MATPNLLQAAPPDILFAFPKWQFAVPWMEGGGGKRERRRGSIAVLPITIRPEHLYSHRKVLLNFLIYIFLG